MIRNFYSESIIEAFCFQSCFGSILVYNFVFVIEKCKRWQSFMFWWKQHVYTFYCLLKQKKHSLTPKVLWLFYHQKPSKILKNTQKYSKTAISNTSTKFLKISFWTHGIVGSCSNLDWKDVEKISESSTM